MTALGIECPSCHAPTGVDCANLRILDFDGFALTRKSTHSARIMTANSADKCVLLDTEDRYILIPSRDGADDTDQIVVEYHGPLGWAVTRNGHELNRDHDWVPVADAFSNPADFRWTRPDAINAAHTVLLR